MKKLLLLALGSVILFAGCTTPSDSVVHSVLHLAPPANGVVYGSAPEPHVASGKAAIFICRNDRSLSGWKCSVLVDDRPVAGIGYKQYTWVEVSPGSHVVTVKWNKFATQMGGGRTTVMAAPGKAQYLKLQTHSAYESKSFQPMVMNWTELSAISQAEVTSFLTGSRYVAAKP